MPRGDLELLAQLLPRGTSWIERHIGRAVLVACSALCACANLSPLETGVCGNEVLDPGEDCDIYPDSTLGRRLECGKPATEAECRYVCSATVSCPRGWDCGSDAICRQASDDFRAGLSSPGFSPESFEPVDFNGDGRVDLAGAFVDRIEFRTGDATGSFAPGFVAPTLPVTGKISVGRLDSDLYDDVLLPTQQGIVVWRGQPEGPPLQAAYAATALPVDTIWGTDLRYPPMGAQGVFLALYDGPSGVAARIVTDRLNGEVIVGAGQTMDQLGSRLAIADLNADGADDIVFGFRGSSVVAIYGVRRNPFSADYVLGGVGSSTPIIIDLSRPRVCEDCPEMTSGMQIDNGVQIADVDGDGHLDLLVSVTAASSETSAVAVVRGPDFADAYIDTRFEFLASSATAAEGYPTKLSPWPIAAGDLNADGVADYVSPNGVFLATTAAPHSLTQTSFRDTLEPWSAATLADFDGDGAVDIAAIAEGEPFVDVLRCSSGDSSCLEAATRGVFVPRRYTTELGVTKLRAGRLQALTAADLVLIERGSDDSTEDALTVMYAESFDWPDNPVRQARFHRIERLEIGLGLFEPVHISTRNTEKKASVGHLTSNGTRQLSSPFPLATYDNVPAETWIGELALVGQFSESGHPYRDLIALGRNAEDLPRAWWIPGAEEAAFDPAEISLDLRPALGDDFDFDCARFAVGDVDGDDRDELIVVFGRGVADTSRCAASAATKLAVGRVTEAGVLAFEVRETPIPDVTDGAAIALSDLDGDGTDDLILARSGRAGVFYGAPSGLALTETLFDLPSGEHVLDATAIARSANARGKNGVVVLTNDSVIVLTADGAKGRIDAENARSLRSADVNGDGLGDLLFSSAGGIEALLATPAPSLGDRR